MRIEPPVLDPSAPSTMPVATAAPAPLEELLASCAGFHGLRAGGHGRSKEGPPRASL